MLKRVDVNPKNYVVLDLETNGLRSKGDDILSLAIYKPDDGKSLERYLPLELNQTVKTTRINGIQEKDLVNAIPLTQKEFNEIVDGFELATRVILIYAGGRGFDDKFLREYLKRKRIIGFEKLCFYNFKKQIISSHYTRGSISKDNLCEMFGISDVKKVHSGINDCRLEWELFKKLDGYYYLVTNGGICENVFRLTPEYIIPASYLDSHPNLSRVVPGIPDIKTESTLIQSFEICSDGIKKFQTNISGVTIEKLIDLMLNVKVIDSTAFLYSNKRKLLFVGKLPISYNSIEMYFDADGEVRASHKKDEGLVKEINDTNHLLKERLVPLVEFIKNEVFKGTMINSQELIIDEEQNVLAKCDLSNASTILEIKTNNADALSYKYQLYYESKGRNCYHMQMDWSKEAEHKILIKFLKVTFEVDKESSLYWNDKPKGRRYKQVIENIESGLKGKNIEVMTYINKTMPIEVRCKQCKKQWKISYYKLRKGEIACPYCYKQE